MMAEVLSAAMIPVAFGIVCALLLGVRAFGVGRPRSNREIVEFVTMTSTISTAAALGHDLHHYWLAIAVGMALAMASSVLLRRLMA